MEHLREFATSVPEYRRTNKGNFKHKLEYIFMLSILGRLCKCTTRFELLRFEGRHLKRLQGQGMFLNGLPSEATLCRMSQSIDDEKMADRLSVFTDLFRKETSDTEPDIICIDDKAMRGTPYGNGRNPDFVSAYSCWSELILETEVCGEGLIVDRENGKAR